MGKINQLSFAVANLIAAGEVVDRPASVVKELLENSIDAGADSITIEIAHGGISLIRVSDNGCGISEEDLPLSIRRHATSKISSAEDLDSIATLGFRGEALAAISAVSDVKIISKTKDAEYGHLLCSVAGGDVEVCEVGCADGTTVIVENIFANVPARRKFLKKDVTESMAVTAVVEKIALSRPDIAFNYLIDGSRKFSTAGDGKVKSAVYAVLGRDFSSRLVEVDSEYDGIRIYGFVGRSDNCRANRNMQNFFINGRYVKSKTACAAIEQAYTSFIAEGKFPVCVLFITISPMSVDVNVHPAKLEVKFSNEKAVFESVYYSVRTALQNHTQKSEFELPRSNSERHSHYQTYRYPVNSEQSHPTQRTTLRPATNSFASMQVKSDSIERRTTLLDRVGSFRLKSTDDETIGFHQAQSSAYTEESASPFARSFDELVSVNRDSEDITLEQAERSCDSDNAVNAQDPAFTDVTADYSVEAYRVIGVCFNTYILVEQSGKLLIIDKHAAHERILFEGLKNNLKKVEHASQMLLLPICITLSYEEYTAAAEYQDEIQKTGFEFTLNEADNLASITAIPDLLDVCAVQDMFVTMLDNLANNKLDARQTRDSVYEKALYQSACKAAVKGGRYDNDDNIAWICDMLMNIPDIKVCPHGRPVITELDKRYIDRQFERIK